jgi:transcriptional regulator with XRE-family HTH domain
MDFGNQIKQIRKEKNITQEQMAQSLNITRQAVSNWENKRNLPDIEILIKIAKVYGVSLDKLILGDDNMNNMTEKLIKDGSETRKSRLNAISVCVGIVLFILGMICLIIRAIVGDWIDVNGMLQEYFFLIPISFVFFFCGFLTFIVTGLRNVVAIFIDNRDVSNKNIIILTIVSTVVCLIFVIVVFILKIANSGL